MNDFLKEIGRSYIVSSLLPTALFIPLGFIIFYDLIPQGLLQKAAQLDIFWGQNWFLFLILIFWVGFLLYSSFQTIIELYIGNWLPERIKQYGRARNKKYYSGLLKSYYLACDVINNITENDNRKKLSEVRPLALSELGRLGLCVPIPLRRDNISQTRIGNIFQSSAVYIADRYNINGKVMWPRLVHVLPTPFLKNLEEKNNYFLFLLNSSLLAGFLGLLGFLIVFVRFFAFLIYILAFLDLPIGILSVNAKVFEKIVNGLAFFQQDTLNFMLIGIAFTFLSYLFYRLATNAAEDYSQIVCSGFDLYRSDLLLQMGVLPKEGDFLYEKRLWGTLCEYMVAGNALGVKDINFIINREKAKYTEADKATASK